MDREGEGTADECEVQSSCIAEDGFQALLLAQQPLGALIQFAVENDAIVLVVPRDKCLYFIRTNT